MSRRSRPPLFGGNTTFAGAVVTVTVCFGALAMLVTGCVMLVIAAVSSSPAPEAVSAGEKMVLQGVAGLGLATGLLSRTRQDPAATIEQPATISARTDVEPA